MVVLSSVQQTLLWAAIPRFCLIGFKIAQPLLLYRVIDYLTSTDSTSESVGKALIGATVLVYMGVAVRVTKPIDDRMAYNDNASVTRSQQCCTNMR